MISRLYVAFLASWFFQIDGEGSSSWWRCVGSSWLRNECIWHVARQWPESGGYLGIRGALLLSREHINLPSLH